MFAGLIIAGIMLFIMLGKLNLHNGNFSFIWELTRTE